MWNEKEARADFAKVLELDPSLEASVNKELKAMEEKLRSKQQEEKGRYKGLFDFNTRPATATTVSPVWLLSNYICVFFLIKHSAKLISSFQGWGRSDLTLPVTF